MKEKVSPKRLFASHYKSLCYYAWDMVKDSAWAEDLVRDVILAYWDQRHRISTNEASIKSFLYTSIRHAVYNLARHHKVVEKYQQRHPLNEIDETDYEHQVIMAELMGELHRLVANLPPACQQIFRLSYFDALSNQEIASELSLSLPTIKTQKQRALKTIRQHLNPELLPIFLAIYFYWSFFTFLSSLFLLWVSYY